MRGDKAAVKSLLQQKADVNAPQADGATALQWAAYKNDMEMADLLIAAGANVKARNRDGATAALSGWHQRQRGHDRKAAEGRGRRE